MSNPSRSVVVVACKILAVSALISLLFVAGCGSANTEPTIGPPAKLAFTAQPSSVAAGSSITPGVAVSIEDAQGNVVTTATSQVTIAIGTNAGSGTLGGTLSATAVNGVATFSNLTINNAGTGYTLAASATGLTGATSGAFNVFGAATKLAFTVQPSAVVAGSAITPSVAVSVEDAAGVAVTTSSASITLAITAATGTAGATLTCTSNPLSAAAGVATFAGCKIDKVGVGYTLTASASGLTGATSSAFNVTVGAAAKLVITQQPTNIVAGVSISPAVTVSIEDSQGNLVTTATNSVSVAIGTNAGGGTLSGTTQVTAVAGVASFSALSINKTGLGYTLAASATGLTSATSSAFNVSVGAAAKLAFTVQPGNATAGGLISPVVSIEDSQGNIVASATNSVSMAIGANPSSGTLSGTTPVTAVSGVAAFPDLSINKVGAGYTLTASATNLTSATSSAFNVTTGAAAKVVFTVQPSNVTAGNQITPSVAVSVEDAAGNIVTTATNPITIAIGTNPSSGTLSGTAQVNAVAGVATFSTLKFDKAGTGYTLTASASNLTAATSSAFNVAVGAAAKLAFTTQPGNVTAGSPIAVVVSVEDSQGNLVTTANNSVSVAIGTNPSAGTLSGTTPVTAVNGVAAFPNLSINKAGAAYTLTASASGVSGTTSSAFNVTAGTAAKLAFIQQPSNVVAATSITPAVTVAIEDTLGNVVTTATTTVSVTIGTNPSSGTLSGTTSVNAIAGIATFSNLKIDNTGNGYTLTASSGVLTSATSNAFNVIVSVGPAAKLAFTVEPSNVVAGSSITPSVQVSVEDSNGNLVTSATNLITVAISTNPSSGSLSGTLGVSAVNGVATFSGLSINKVGTGYTLGATATSLTAATSGTFNVTLGAAAKLVFTQQPSNVAAGSPITPAVTVSIEDGAGNVVTTASNSVSMAIETNPSSGTLSGTTPITAVNGVATFSDLSINNLGTGYTLTATATNLTAATSSAFNVAVGAPVKLVFTQQPSNVEATSSITPAVTVSIEDAAGDVVTTANNSVSIAIGTNPSSGTLSGTTPVTAVNGVATFSNLSINNTGTGYTLTASATNLTGVTSNTFNVTAFTGPATVDISLPGGAPIQAGGTARTLTITVANDQSGDVLTPSLTVDANTGLGCTAATCGTIGTISGTSGSGSYTLSYTPPSSLTTSAGPTLVVSSSLTGSFTATTSFNVFPAGLLVRITGIVGTQVVNGPATTNAVATVYNDVGNAGVTFLPLTAGGYACQNLSPNSCGTLVIGATTTSGTTTTTHFTYTPPTSGPPSPPYDRPRIQATSVHDNTKFASRPIVITSTAGPALLSIGGIVNSALTGISTTLTADFTDTTSIKTAIWTLTASGSNCQPICGTLGTATVSTNGNSVTSTITYTAPASVPTGADASPTITATMAANSSATDSFSFAIADGSCGTGHESQLSGQYAFLLRGGAAGNGYRTAIGSFTANGSGGISGGLEDFNTSEGAQTGLSILSAGSSYSVGTDNRGCLTLANSSGGTATYRIAVGTVSGGVATQGTIIRFDDNFGGSGRLEGVLMKQDSTSFNPSGISGTYVFGEEGVDSSGGRAAAAGLVTSNGAGTLSNLSFDFDDAGTIGNPTGGSGTYSIAVNAPSGRGTFTTTITSGGGPSTSNSVLYIVSSSEALFMTTDAISSNNPILSGEIKKQTGSFTATTLDSKDYVISASGIDQSDGGNDIVIGQTTFTTNGNATLTIDENQGGTENPEQTGPAVFTIASNGRMTATGIGNHPPVLYLADSNFAFVIGTDNSVAFGRVEKQTGGPFTTTQFSGTYFFGGGAPTAETTYDTGTVSLDGTGGITGNDEFSGPNGLGREAISGTYAFSNTSVPVGKGSLGSDSLGYAVSTSRVIFMNTGTDPELFVVQK